MGERVRSELKLTAPAEASEQTALTTHTKYIEIIKNSHYALFVSRFFFFFICFLTRDSKLRPRFHRLGCAAAAVRGLAHVQARVGGGGGGNHEAVPGAQLAAVTFPRHHEAVQLSGWRENNRSEARRKTRRRATDRRCIHNILSLSVEVTVKQEINDSDRRVASGAVGPTRREAALVTLHWRRRRMMSFHLK